MSADHDAEMIVVGAGITGAATARELARGGSAVVLLEQFELGNTRGSSHGTSRIFRLAYPEPAFVRMAGEALSAWLELEADYGGPLILRTGSLDLGPIALVHARSLATCGVRHEMLVGSDVSARWPISVEDDVPALLQPDGGITLADRAYEAFLEGARAAGASIRQHAPAAAVTPDRAAVRVDLADGTDLRAAAVVITAGAWAPRLLDPLGLDIAATATRETVAFFDLQADELPTIIDDALAPAQSPHRPAEISYALAAPGEGLKVGLHHAGPATDPDEQGEPDPEILAWASEWFGRRFSVLEPSLVRAETCLYTNRTDASFVLERHGRVVVGAACSGHGFKFAPLHGRTLADLARVATRG